MNKTYRDNQRNLWIEERTCPKCKGRVIREIMSDRWFVECCDKEECNYWDCGFSNNIKIK
jgi:hypothetical protein